MTEIDDKIYDSIERIVRRLEREKVSTFEYNDADVHLRLAFGRTDIENTEVESEKPAGVIKTPSAGIFTVAHPLDHRKDTLTSGVPVRAGQIVGYLQVGPVLRPVMSSREGILGRPLVGDGVLVGAQQSVFELHEPRTR
jgi:hypothetical protein